MPINLKKINNSDAINELSIVWDEETGDTLKLTYNRSKFTPAIEKKLNLMVKDGLIGGGYANILLTVLLGWDVETPEDVDIPTDEVDEEGTLIMYHVPAGKVPLTEESLTRLLSIEAIGKIVEKLGEDNRPNPSKSLKPKDF